MGIIKEAKTLTHSVNIITNADEQFNVESMDEFMDLLSTLQMNQPMEVSSPTSQQGQGQLPAAASQENIELNLLQKFSAQGLLQQNVDPNTLLASLKVPQVGSVPPQNININGNGSPPAPQPPASKSTTSRGTKGSWQTIDCTTTLHTTNTITTKQNKYRGTRGCTDTTNHRGRSARDNTASIIQSAVNPVTLAVLANS